MKQTQTMYLFARTPVHVGAGNSVGAVDSPIMRERHTRIPIIPGSSLKGVLADLWAGDVDDEKGKRKKNSNLVTLFGSDDDKAASAGTLLVGEARVLAFPLRSAAGGFAWITCPHVLRKWKEDTKAKFAVPNVENEKCLASKDICVGGGNDIVLEEYKFDRTGDVSGEIVAAFASIMPNSSVWEKIKTNLAIVSDELFSYFVENACEIVSRIRVNDETGTVDGSGLFNQEQCPSETMFYTVICDAGREASIDAIGTLKEKLNGVGNVIQIGGDATIGLGFCSVSFK